MAIKNRIVILASGRGSNFCAISDAIKQNRIPQSQVIALICNKANALVLEEANRRQIPSFTLESNLFRSDNKFNRAAYELKLLELLQELNPDLILLAGYMLILGKEVVRAFPMRIINIHPSLLPKYRGLHAQQQALKSGDKETGCTVHWVTEGLDEGEPILQTKTPILAGDTEESLTQRLLSIEHETYVAAVKMILEKI